jgi:hypothetical protein
VHQATVKYAERSLAGTGTVELNDVHARILGMGTPDMAPLSPLTLDAQGMLQRTGPFRLNVAFRDRDPLDGFTYRFALGAMPMEAFNSILGPAAHIRIERGDLDTLHVVAEANDSVAIGSMGMYYSRLHIGLLKKGAEEGEGLLQTFGGWLANAVVRTNHPQRADKGPAAVYFERMQDRSVFHYLIKQTLSGIPGNVRLPDKKRKARRGTPEALQQRLGEEHQ